MKNIQNHSVAYDTPTPITPIFLIMSRGNLRIKK